MAVPKQHDSKGKVGSRRSQKNLKKQNLHPCPSCQSPKLSHRACPNCGFHKTAKQGKAGKPQMKMESKQESLEKENEESKQEENNS